MALHWDLTKVSNADEICWVEADKDYPEHGIEKGKSYMSPVTNAIIWRTMAVGIGKITEANAGDFWARARFLDLLGGYGDRSLTMDEIRQHIGLTTNVVNESKSAWLKRTSTREYDDLVCEAKR